MSVYCECCVFSGRGLYDELITRTEESYRLWCVAVFYLETIKFLGNEEEAKAHSGGYRAKRKKMILYYVHTGSLYCYTNLIY